MGGSSFQSSPLISLFGQYSHPLLTICHQPLYGELPTRVEADEKNAS